VVSNQADDSDESDDAELTSTEVRGWIEFGCWTAVAVAPVIYWVNGRVVSTDQLVVRMAFIMLAFCGAATLRIYAWLHRD
jgi:hypothetical protein